MSQIVIRVPDELERQLRAAAAQSGVDMSEYVLPALETLAGPSCDSTPARSSIWDRIDEIWSHVPQEDLDTLPVDGPEQHDHYVYGTPKRDG